MRELKLLKCKLCSMLVEGVEGISCPRCKMEMQVIASYPDLEEEDGKIKKGYVPTQEV